MKMILLLQRRCALIVLSTVLILGDARATVLRPTSHQRMKRSIFQLCAVMNTYTARNCFSYMGYGCYCGNGGAGVPVDAVDRCCQAHDYCYGSLACNGKTVWTNVDCALGSCTCRDPPATCNLAACTCDVKFGECLSKAVYNKAFANYPQRKCANATTTAAPTSTTTPPQSTSTTTPPRSTSTTISSTTSTSTTTPPTTSTVTTTLPTTSSTPTTATPTTSSIPTTTAPTTSTVTTQTTSTTLTTTPPTAATSTQSATPPASTFTVTPPAVTPQPSPTSTSNTLEIST